MTTEPPPAPVSLWVWPVVALVSFSLIAGYCVYDDNRLTDPQRHKDNVTFAVSFGLINGLGLTSGMYIACRMFEGWLARSIGTVVFGALMMIVSTAVVFAGCMVTRNIFTY